MSGHDDHRPLAAAPGQVRRCLRGVIAALGLALAATISSPLVTSTPGASAAVSGAACSDNAGVTVIVDLGDLGGGVSVRCAAGPSRDGLDALDRAGFTYRTALRSPGFVCRIDNLPANEPCVDASPAAAYWSYWLANRGGSWCYAKLGAANRTPIAGTVEGWAFSRDHTAANLSTPAVAPPPPPAIDGVPRSLPGGDCDRSSVQPTTSSPPRVTSAPPVSGASGSSPAPPAPTKPANRTVDTGRTAPAPAVAPTAGSGAREPVTTATKDPTTAPQSTEDGEPVTTTAASSAAAGAAEVRGAVAERDVARSPTHTDSDSPSPIGAAVAALAIVSLSGASIIRARRTRKRMP